MQTELLEAITPQPKSFKGYTDSYNSEMLKSFSYTA